eukprot:365845-Chlamydomonas_euryale.AAC.3
MLRVVPGAGIRSALLGKGSGLGWVHVTIRCRAARVQDYPAEVLTQFSQALAAGGAGPELFAFLQTSASLLDAKVRPLARSMASLLGGSLTGQSSSIKPWDCLAAACLMEQASCEKPWGWLAGTGLMGQPPCARPWCKLAEASHMGQDRRQASWSKSPGASFLHKVCRQDSCGKPHGASLLNKAWWLGSSGQPHLSRSRGKLPQGKPDGEAPLAAVHNLVHMGWQRYNVTHRTFCQCNAGAAGI